jgi:phosphoglycolate phosphatase
MPLRAVLYDWDGTLVDSAEASFRCYESMFGAHGIPFDRAAFARTYSPDWHKTYRALGLPRERWEAADAHFVEAYCAQAVPLVAGARELLDAAAALGLAQGVVTSGSRPRVEREIQALGVSRHVAVLVCGDDISRRKPDPEALLMALDALRVAPRDAAYVGDSPEDVGMARNAGVRSIGVPGGFPNREALFASKPDAMVESPAGAADVLRRWAG